LASKKILKKPCVLWIKGRDFPGGPCAPSVCAYDTGVLKCDQNYPVTPEPWIQSLRAFKIPVFTLLEFPGSQSPEWTKPIRHP